VETLSAPGQKAAKWLLRPATRLEKILCGSKPWPFSTSSHSRERAERLAMTNHDILLHISTIPDLQRRLESGNDSFRPP
jgi:hypothetical protein